MAALHHDCYDTPWKRAMVRHFGDFMAFFFERQWRDIDWRRPIRFDDKELQKICPGARPRSLVVDLLVRAFLHDGREVLLHVEVQAQRDRGLAQRVLDYNYGLCRAYRLPVASLVVLADAGRRWRQDACYNCLLGTRMGICFAVAKVAQHAQRIDALLQERNVFAWVSAAHLLAQQTHGCMEQRYAAKWRLVRLLYQRGGHKRRIMDLFMVINGLLPLPEDGERRLWRGIRQLERRQQMQWISPLEQWFLNRGEQRGLRKGLQQGLRQGREEGREEGRRQGALIVLERQLASRFGPPSATVRKRLQRASVEQLAQWSEAVLEARTLGQVFSSRD